MSAGASVLPDLTAVDQQTNANGEIIGYACEYLTSTASGYNKLDALVVPSYYDLAYPCTEDPQDIYRRIAARLLVHAATQWGIIPKGETCTGVGVFVDGNALLAVSSTPDDTLEGNLDCQKLVPGTGECCVVVHNQMTFTPYIPYSEIKLWAYVAGMLDSGDLVYKNETFRTKYIGSEVDSANQATDMPPAVSGVEQQQPPQSDQGGGFSVAGSIILSGIVVAMLGLLVIILRRRSQERKVKEIGAALSNTEPELPRDIPFRVTVLSDEAMLRAGRSFDSHHNQSTWASTHEDDDHLDDDEDSSKKEFGCYAFDLASSFRRSVMANHGMSKVSSKTPQQSLGPTTIEVVPPYPISESDSEVDSWAQTDGTVGSLEERMDEMTSEI